MNDVMPKYTDEEIESGIMRTDKKLNNKYDLADLKKMGKYSTSAKPITQTETYRRAYVTHTKHPLTFREARFIDEYMATGDKKLAAERAGFTVKDLASKGSALLRKDYISEEIAYRTEIYASELVADRNEVLEYLTAVMRGEVKDQFGLDAPLAERTSAAKELKKIFIDDVEKGKQTQAQQVVVNIDMSRDADPETVVDIQQLSD